MLPLSSQLISIFMMILGFWASLSFLLHYGGLHITM